MKIRYYVIFIVFPSENIILKNSVYCFTWKNNSYVVRIFFEVQREYFSFLTVNVYNDIFQI
ncbi:hypothetical protein AmDm5_0482 [Acetobacter malorum]|nr:hypothetical protein AmDm5_0482 [Acetobacter malorum]